MGKPWFHPKRYGIGAGLPCSWEGWAVLAIFAAGMLGGPWLLEGADWRLRAGVGGLAVVALIVIVGVKTRGGMRWRWGQD